MRFLILLAAVLVTTFFAACSTTNQRAPETEGERFTRVEKARSADSNTVEVNTAESGLDLTNYLRRIPGMQIRGSGPDATIRVRDSRSAQSDTSPLYVVDGTIIGNSYSRLYSTIDVNEIKRVRVLKAASETNRYGSQGSNGVLEITLR